jgi:Domain of unknown function (DUF5658)
MNSATTDNRYGKDRRVKPTPFLSRYALTGGRRKTVRRKHDQRKHIFVDLYDTRLFIAIFALLIMNVLDGFLTLLLIKENLIVEANPVMAFCLDYGHVPFFWVKYLLMAFSLLIFCIFRGFKFSNISLASSILLYASVLIYELRIVYDHYPSLFLQ